MLAFSKSVLGILSRVYIDEDAVPVHDVAVLVAQRLSSYIEPAIGAMTDKERAFEPFYSRARSA
jgi:hypothetical protein